MGGCDVGNALVDGRHGSRQRVDRLASLLSLGDEIRSWSSVVERKGKELGKICAMGKKGKVRRGEAGRLDLSADDKHNPTRISDHIL